MYLQPINDASTFARQAFDKMTELNIASNPSNFTLWYTYFAELDLDLKRALDQNIEKKAIFTEALLNELYEKFINRQVSTQRKSQKINTSTEVILSKMISIVDNVSDNAKDYGEALAAGKDISQSSTPQEISDVVDRLVKATYEMETKNKELEEKLDESRDKIVNLSKEIEDVNREALTDGLTQIANRKCFDMEIRKNAAACMDAGANLNLMMIDIDHFKKFNDNYGHLVGDQVIKLLAQTLRECVKDMGLPARYGGEEFSVILPKLSTDESKELAERIRKMVASRTLKNRSTGESLGAVTISIGVTYYHFGESISQFIKRADDALYAAKGQGRNRVIIG